MLPSKKGFDDFTIEYPFPFWNPADRRFYVYYLGRRERPPKQTGLLVGDGDFDQWTGVCQTPVIAADTEHERYGSSHPSVVVVDDTIHIIYTGESTGLPAICHATASTSNPAIRRIPLIPSSKVPAKHGTVAASGRRKSSLAHGISTSSTVDLMVRFGGLVMFGRTTSVRSNLTRTILFLLPRQIPALGTVTEY